MSSKYDEVIQAAIRYTKEDGASGTDCDLKNAVQDAGLLESGAESLADQHGGHWGQHPDHPAEDWRYEVGNNDTRLGYWDWVEDRIRNAD